MAAKKEKGTKKGHQVNVKCDDALYARLSQLARFNSMQRGSSRESS